VIEAVEAVTPGRTRHAPALEKLPAIHGDLSASDGFGCDALFARGVCNGCIFHGRPRHLFL